MRRLGVVVGLGLAVALSAQPAAAQEEESYRSALWFTVGFAYGSGGVDCPDCMGLLDGRLGGVAGMLGLGWTLSPAIVLGVETQWWVRPDAFFTLAVANVNGVVLVYPKKTLGLWFKGGAGFLAAGGSAPGVEVTGTGAGWTLGVGYDLYLGRTIAFTPYLSYVGSGNVDTKVNEVPVDISLSPNFWQLGIAVTAP